MRIAGIFTVAVATLVSLPLAAQQADAGVQANTSATAAGTHTSDSADAGASVNAGARDARANLSADSAAKTTYAATAGAWGDHAASHAWEMSSISGQLEGKLDSKTARAGDRVVLKTTEKAQTPDGTVIPKGSRLVGHVTDVQAYDKDRGAAHMGIAFDRVEMKNGENFGIYTLIRGVMPGTNAAANSAMMDDDAMIGAPMGGGRMGGGAPAMGGGRGGGLLGGAGSAVNNTAGMAGGVADRTAATADSSIDSLGERTSSGLDATTNSAVQTAGHGDLNLNTDAHAEAVQRLTPHPTGVAGVMLAGNSASSGTLSAAKKNFTLESGTQMQLGIVANR